jgi:hypothetical protein
MVSVQLNVVETGPQKSGKIQGAMTYIDIVFPPSRNIIQKIRAPGGGYKNQQVQE